MRIKRFVKHVAVKTAAVPNPLVDRLVVTYNTFTMIGDLCLIYNVRPSGFGTGVILGRALLHAYLAGELEEATELLVEPVQDAVTFLGEMGSTVAGKLTAKLSEGGLNAVFVYRLGITTQRMLQPTK